MRLLLPLPGQEGFARRLAEAGGFEVAAVHTRRFPDGERYVRIETDPAGRTVDLVCSLANAHADFLTLAFAADAARDLGATAVNLVAPYLGYMRQDARFQPGEAITSRTFARLLSSSVDHLLTVDPHLHRIHDLEDLYDIPCTVLHAAPLIGAWIRSEVEKPLIVGPDAESVQWAAEIAATADAPFVVLSKERRGDRDVRITVPDVREHAGRQPVLVDDIASSGRTLVAAAAQLHERGFSPPVCVVVHAIFAADSLANVAAVSRRVVSTDTLVHPTNAITLVPTIAGALERIA